MPLSGAGAGASTSVGIFNGIVRTAAAAGIIAGLLLTGVQHLQVIPIIGQAEVYEASQGAAAGEPAAGAPASVTAHEHAAPAGAEHGHGHEDAHAHASEEAHSHGGWEPEDGLERTLYTVLADVSMAVGYALLLAALICLRGNASAINWRSGLLWGAAGYAVFFIAPSLGLPPELPGTAAAPVAARQGWWLCTALSTAVALGMLVFGRKPWLKVGAVALLFVPYLAGAPQPLVHASAAPAELASSFIVATALANAVFWLALGGLTGYFSKRFG